MLNLSGIEQMWIEWGRTRQYILGCRKTTRSSLFLPTLTPMKSLCTLIGKHDTWWFFWSEFYDWTYLFLIQHGRESMTGTQLGDRRTCYCYYYWTRSNPYAHSHTTLGGRSEKFNSVSSLKLGGKIIRVKSRLTQWMRQHPGLRPFIEFINVTTGGCREGNQNHSVWHIETGWLIHLRLVNSQFRRCDFLFTHT